MIKSNFIVPLSPPISPGMSVYGNTHFETSWSTTEAKALECSEHISDNSNNMAVLPPKASMVPFELERKPIFSHHRSFSYSFNPSSHHLRQTSNGIGSSGSSPASRHERISISKFEEEIAPHEMANTTFDGAALNSPISRLTPPSPYEDQNTGQEDQEQMEFDDQAADEEEPRQMTAAELRAQKRKMKRFRLTHSQTRFLMSEFSRQAHPDAAHRERLSREIPGLSPRQVQVWFQNRRAKLKRLTSDDQKRMVRSRALPDDFDMTQAMQSPFGSGQVVANQISPPETAAGSFSGKDMSQTLSIDTLRSRQLHLSPTNVSPGLSKFTFTPPQSATEVLPSDSSNQEPNAFSYSSAPIEEIPRKPSDIGSPTSLSPNYALFPHMPQVQIHDQITRTRAISLSSPFPNNMYYSTPMADSMVTRSGDSSMYPSPHRSEHGTYQGDMVSNPGLSYPMNYNCTSHKPR